MTGWQCFPILGLAALLFVPPTPVAAAAGSASITIELDGLRNTKGQAIALVYRSNKGFPMDMDEAARRITLNLSGAKGSMVIPKLTPGIYAISVIHDENANGSLDTNWIGMPKEGVGASNNPKGFMGPPKFKDARFSLPAEGTRKRVEINYL